MNLRLNVATNAHEGIWAVTVNDVAARFANARSLENGNRLLTYSIPSSALPGRSSDTIRVAAAERPIQLLGVEVRISPAQE